ncbi:Bromodomain-containing protein [Xylaria intraflava]|nr:Bromodomain-containing protein [Xylaria intraflava]
MESKRKAGGANGLEGTNDVDRAAKRRKLMEEYGDLANGESCDSTTAYGLSILESIRATTDKNGRRVAPYFETLPLRAEHPEYYRKIRLPLSLEVIERKLREQQYPALSSVESDFKRLVSNAKETHDRGSIVFSDAERLRKAVSNLMVKYNPAYKTGNYQAVPTPLPPTPEPEDEEDAGEALDEMDTNLQATGEDELESISQDIDADTNADVEAQTGSRRGTNKKADELDEDADEIDEADEDDDEDDEDDDDDEDPQPGRRRGSSWRQAGSRPSRDSATPARKLIPRTGKADHYYENVPFKGLNFQQAQEKIVEELIRRKEDPDDYPYFEPFVYLPPRTLKDYYEIIAEPLSLKALQKQVRGQHGRSEATYISDFKGWSAFEDQASLIWRNAYHYNEDGSEIFVMAQELEEAFQELLREAKKNVQEPLQPKIKLKLPPAADLPGHHKKITIHVGGKTSVSGSPAPAPGQPGESETTRKETPLTRNTLGGASSAGTSVNLNQVEQTRSMSASAGPPSPSVIGAAKTEDSMQTAPIMRPQATPATFQHSGPVAAHAGLIANGITSQYQQSPAQATPPPPPPPPPPPQRSPSDILEAQKYRPVWIRESEALMPRVVIVTHPTLPVENKLLTTIPASISEYQQDIIINAPASQFRVQLKPVIAPFLEMEQREWKLNVIHDGVRLYPSSVSFDRRGEPIFDVTMRYGVNRLEVALVAALPRGQTAPNGLRAEMERVVVHYNLLRH